MALIKSKKFKKNIFSKFYNKTTNFLKNCDFITLNRYQNIANINNNNRKKSAIKGYNKLIFLKKLNFRKIFYNKFLFINKLELNLHPLYLYERSIKLKY